MATNEHIPPATTADWTRDKKGAFTWLPSRSLLASVRSYQYWKSRGTLEGLLSKIAVMRYRFWSIVTGSDLQINNQIGDSLRMPHLNVVFIHPNCKKEKNCYIFQQATWKEVRLV